MTEFYTYWQGDNPPKYIELCIASWFRHIPDLKLTVISHKNLSDWVDDVYDIDKLKNYSLPMQSDAVSAAVLARHGGTFIDADTILTKNPTEFLSHQKSDVIKCFGMPTTRQFHVAVLSIAGANGSIPVKWMSEISKRLDSQTPGRSWDHLGGQILHPLVNSKEFFPKIDILDRRTEGNIIESYFDFGKGQGKLSYEELYFSRQQTVSVEMILENCPGGIISLHNSWTPKEFSSLQSTAEVLKSPGTLAGILREVSDPKIAINVGKEYL